MNGHVGQPERATQDRVVALFRNEMGHRYLGDWTDRVGNSNVEEQILSAWLTKSGYAHAQIGVALLKLRRGGRSPPCMPSTPRNPPTPTSPMPFSAQG